MQSPTKRPGHTLTILTAPDFERGRPPRDALIWRISLSASRAFTLICDIGHLYPSHEWRPQVGAMLEADGAWTLYVWPRTYTDSALLLLMIRYGATRLADASHWHGEAWVSGDLLAKIFAALAYRASVAEEAASRAPRSSWLAELVAGGKP